jgi:hypothetical protein
MTVPDGVTGLCDAFLGNGEFAARRNALVADPVGTGPRVARETGLELTDADAASVATVLAEMVRQTTIYDAARRARSEARVTASRESPRRVHTVTLILSLAVFLVAERHRRLRRR